MTITEALNLQDGDQVRSNSVGRIYTVKGITLDAGSGKHLHIYILTFITPPRRLRKCSNA
jgi:hypothetical protein